MVETLLSGNNVTINLKGLTDKIKVYWE